MSRISTIEYMNSEKMVYKKLNIVTFICTIFVIYIHADNMSQYDLSLPGGSIVAFIESTLFAAIINNAVPIFFFISGFLFFRNFDLSKTKEKYQKRVKSVVIPYFVWTTIYTGIALFFTVTPLGNIMNDSWKMIPVSLENIVRGVLLYEYVPVFWYMFYLMFFILVSPIIYWLIDNRVRGVIFLVIYIGLCMLRTPYCSIGFFMYSLGGYCSIHCFNIFNRTFSKKQSYLGLGVFVATAMIRVFLICKGVDNLVLVQITTETLMLIGLYMFSGLFAEKEIRPVVKRQFFIYATHLFIISLVKKIFRMLLPGTPAVALLTYIICPILVVIIANVVAMIMEKTVPKVYSILSGGRMTDGNK